MKSLHQIALVLMLLLVLCNNTNAQHVHLGYTSPYASTQGLQLGYTMQMFKNSKANHSWELSFKANYFQQAGVSRQVYVHPAWGYKRQKPNKSFFLSAFCTAGYLMAFQQTDGTLNLATGEMDYSSELQQYFVPTLHVGGGVAPKKRLGFYAEFFYGRKISLMSPNAAFFGASAGILISLTSNKQK